MQNFKTIASLVFLLVFPALLFSGSQVDPSLVPWLGVWSIVEDESAVPASGPNSTPTVEIRSTAEGKGLEISRKAMQQPEVKETLIPDGTKRPVQSDSCSGWQTSRLIPSTGTIVTSSEMDCKDAGSFTTSGMRMIVAGNQMLDILGIKVAGQIRIATRHLQFERELALSGDSLASMASASARSAASAPWSVESIIQLSSSVEAAVLQAALVERNARVDLTAKVLKQLQRAGVREDVIDLLVALEYPDRFDIQRNGQVALVSRGTSSNVYYPPNAGYYPGTFYGCYDPNGVLLSAGACWNYYSPLWWDYPVYFGRPQDRNAAQLSATRGYVQIEPRETGRHARLRDALGLSSQSSGVSAQRPVGVSSTSSTSSVSSSSGESSAPPSSSSGSSGGGSAASSSGSSGSSASPGGYSSGSSSGSHATRKD